MQEVRKERKGGKFSVNGVSNTSIFFSSYYYYLFVRFVAWNAKKQTGKSIRLFVMLPKDARQRVVPKGYCKQTIYFSFSE